MEKNVHPTMISERIKSLRETHGETQQDVADALGVKRETVKFWEGGLRQIKAWDIVGLAEHFNVSSDYLLGLTLEQTTNAEIKAVCKYTGLSERAVYYVRDTQRQGDGEGMNVLIGSVFFPNLCEKISDYLTSLKSASESEDKGTVTTLLDDFCTLHPELIGKVRLISDREYIDQKLNEIADYLKMALSVETAHDLYGITNQEGNNE